MARIRIAAPTSGGDKKVAFTGSCKPAHRKLDNAAKQPTYLGGSRDRFAAELRTTFPDGKANCRLA